MKHQDISTSLSILLLLLLVSISVTVVAAAAALDLQDLSKEAPLVRKEKRNPIADTESGRISAVQINDGVRGKYQLQFITLEPNSLFLPVLLQADMVFYVQSGNGGLSWVDEDGNKNRIDIKRGDVYRIGSGSIFFVKSSLKNERENLRICAIFGNADNLAASHLFSEPYSSLNELIMGFDEKVLQAAFQVSGEVVERITRITNPPPIVHAPSTNKTSKPDWSERIMEILVGGASYELSGQRKKAFNIMDSKPDFQNYNGWSKTVNRKDLRVLKGANIGAFIVNLTQGSMMAPHWNPRASEIAIALHGKGMVRVVCPRIANRSECKNRRFRVEEGDVFAVPKFHPMAQMAYNNGTFVFMGFSTTAKKTYPQFLSGRSSILQTLDKDILALSFNVSNATTIRQLLSSQTDSVILGCLSCAEEEEMRMQEEREREEAGKGREEEEKTERRGEEEKTERGEEEKRSREEEAQRQHQGEEEAATRQEEGKEESRIEEEETRRQEEDKERREWPSSGRKEGRKGGELGGGPRRHFLFNVVV